MSALVNYDSSSDDEENASNPSGTEQSNNTSSGDRVDGNSEVNQNNYNPQQYGLLEQEKQPESVFGPQIPSGPETNHFDYGNGDDGHESQSQMSERDLLRYLTPATHPITQLPASPPGSPDASTSAKFERFLDLKGKNVHFNKDLASKTTFRNPSLLSLMMARAGIEGDAQYSNSLPAAVFDPSSLPSFAYKEKLLESQHELHMQDVEQKKVLTATGKRSIEFAPAAASRSTQKHKPEASA